jgi:predicted nucleic-acid-binding protein
LKGVDTNILVRFLTADDRDQFHRAKTVLESGSVFIPTTVLLETEWVLRSVYAYSPQRIADAIRAIGGLGYAVLEHPDRIGTAVTWLAQGMDFADALHLAAAADCDAFISFDQRLAKSAAHLTNLPVHET